MTYTSIYLVFDSSLLRNIIREFFCDLGYRVVCRRYNDIDSEPGESSTGNSGRGLTILSLHGAEYELTCAIRRVRHHTPRSPILVLSRSSFGLTTRQALSLGVFGFLREPFTLQELELLVIRALQHSVDSEEIEARHLGGQRWQSKQPPQAGLRTV